MQGRILPVGTFGIIAARDLIVLILIALLLCFLYLLRGIFIPLLLALVFAHVFNPNHSARTQMGLPAASHDRGLVGYRGIGLFGFICWLGPLLVAQMTDLVFRLADHPRTLASTYGIDVSEMEGAMRQYQIDLQRILFEKLLCRG